MQNAGVPTVSVMTEAFADMAKTVGRSLGYADLPILVVPHPFESLPEERVREMADERFDEIVAMLSKALERPAGTPP